jgi:hypothetical protein
MLDWQHHMQSFAVWLENPEKTGAKASTPDPELGPQISHAEARTWILSPEEEY